MNTVALCMICKNEESNIGELLSRVCPILEEVHIVDTGSTDNTLPTIKKLQEQYSNLHLYHFEWVDDFAVARNYSVSRCQKADWIFWLDGDDLIDASELKKFKDEVLEAADVDVWYLPYHYGGKTIISRERFARRSNNPEWQCAIHEYLDPKSSKTRQYNNLAVIHNHTSKVRDQGRNLRILAKEYAKDSSHTRMSYYYGKELYDAGEHEKAKIVLQAYLDIPVGKYFDDEVSARYRLATLYLNDKQYQRALDIAERIYHLSVERNRAEYYYLFGEVELALGNTAAAAAWYERCLCSSPTHGVINHHLWTTMPLNRLLTCNRDLGQWDEVFRWADKAQHYPECRSWIEQVTQQYKVHPKEDNGEVNLEFGLSSLPNAYRVNDEPLLVSVGKYAKFKPANWVLGERLPFLSSSIDGIAVDTSRSKVLMAEVYRVLKPGGKLVVAGNLEASSLKRVSVSRVASRRKKVGFFTGPTWGYQGLWDLDSWRTTGIAGAECVEGWLARAAAECGHEVIMYGAHEHKEQYGVQLVPLDKFKPEEHHYDLFVASRNLNCVDERLRAKSIVGHAHDSCFSSGKNISEFHRKKFTRFVALSPWHKKYLTEHHNLPSDTIDIIPNCVSVEMFSDMTLEKKLGMVEWGRLHWSSSPARGLDNVLYCLPWVLDKCPDLKLHVYYGFDNWEAIAKRNGDSRELERIEQVKEKIKELGVINHGHVSQELLAEHWKRAWCLFYPTSVWETHFNTGVECMASFTVPVTSNEGALSTTLGGYGIRVEEAPYSAEARQKYIAHLINLYNNKDYWVEKAVKARSGVEDRNYHYVSIWRRYWEKYVP